MVDIETILQELYTALYNIKTESKEQVDKERYPKPKEWFEEIYRRDWRKNLKSHTDSSYEAFEELRRYSENPLLAPYWKILESYELSLYGKREDIKPKDAYDISGRMVIIIKKIQEQLEKEKSTTYAPQHAVATAAIIILALIGFATLLFTSNETAAVVSPTVVNLPLGITFLAILVIAVIAMPHRKN